MPDETPTTDATRYDAFISFTRYYDPNGRHGEVVREKGDYYFAEQLQGALQLYRLPTRALRARFKRKLKAFVDENNVINKGGLKETYGHALASSDHLIVVCSKAATREENFMTWEINEWITIQKEKILGDNASDESAFTQEIKNRIIETITPVFLENPSTKEAVGEVMPKSILSLFDNIKDRVFINMSTCGTWSKKRYSREWWKMLLFRNSFVDAKEFTGIVGKLYGVADKDDLLRLHIRQHQKRVAKLLGSVAAVAAVIVMLFTAMRGHIRDTVDVQIRSIDDRSKSVLAYRNLSGGVGLSRRDVAYIEGELESLENRNDSLVWNTVIAKDTQNAIGEKLISAYSSLADFSLDDANIDEAERYLGKAENALTKYAPHLGNRYLYEAGIQRRYALREELYFNIPESDLRYASALRILEDGLAAVTDSHGRVALLQEKIVCLGAILDREIRYLAPRDAIISSLEEFEKACVAADAAGEDANKSRRDFARENFRRLVFQDGDSAKERRDRLAACMSALNAIPVDAPYREEGISGDALILSELQFLADYLSAGYRDRSHNPRELIRLTRKYIENLKTGGEDGVKTSRVIESAESYLAAVNAGELLRMNASGADRVNTFINPLFRLYNEYKKNPGNTFSQRIVSDLLMRYRDVIATIDNPRMKSIEDEQKTAMENLTERATKGISHTFDQLVIIESLFLANFTRGSVKMNDTSFFISNSISDILLVMYQKFEDQMEEKYAIAGQRYVNYALAYAAGLEERDRPQEAIAYLRRAREKFVGPQRERLSLPRYGNVQVLDKHIAALEKRGGSKVASRDDASLASSVISGDAVALIRDLITRIQAGENVSEKEMVSIFERLDPSLVRRLPLVYRQQMYEAFRSEAETLLIEGTYGEALEKVKTFERFASTATSKAERTLNTKIARGAMGYRLKALVGLQRYGEAERVMTTAIADMETINPRDLYVDYELFRSYQEIYEGAMQLLEKRGQFREGLEYATDYYLKTEEFAKVNTSLSDETKKPYLVNALLYRANFELLNRNFTRAAGYYDRAESYGINPVSVWEGRVMLAALEGDMRRFTILLAIPDATLGFAKADHSSCIRENFDTFEKYGVNRQPLREYRTLLPDVKSR